MLDKNCKDCEHWHRGKPALPGFPDFKYCDSKRELRYVGSRTHCHYFERVARKEMLATMKMVVRSAFRGS